MVQFRIWGSVMSIVAVMAVRVVLKINVTCLCLHSFSHDC